MMNLILTDLKRILKLHRTPLALLAGTWGIHFLWIFTSALQMRPDGLYAGHENIWSDWALHTAQAHIFAFRSPSEWMSDHPVFAGGKFTYGFFTNWIAGMLIRLGFSTPAAMNLPQILYSWLLGLGLYLVSFRFLKRKSWALVAVFIFWMSSGWGWLGFLKDLFTEGPAYAFNLPQREDYGAVRDWSWLASNVVTAILMPQRAFLSGMTLAIWGCLAFWRGWDEFAIYRSAKRRGSPWFYRRWWLVAAFLMGLLPITHFHTLIVLMVPIAAYCATEVRHWKEGLWFVVPLGVLSASLYGIFVHGGIQDPDFFKWQPGWTLPGGLGGWIWGWFRIWGSMLPLAVTGAVVWARRPESLARGELLWALGFFVVWALANLFLFQPIVWDNSKLFYWSYFAFSLMAARALQWVAESTWWVSAEGKKTTPRRKLPWALATLLGLSLTATGALELTRIVKYLDSPYRLLEREEMTLAEEVRNLSGGTDRFVTAPIHNHWVAVWAARPVLMGYPAWAMNFGFDWSGRGRQIEEIYRGGPRAERLIDELNAKFLVLGPAEQQAGLATNSAYFEGRYPKVAVRGGNTVYRLR